MNKNHANYQTSPEDAPCLATIAQASDKEFLAFFDTQFSRFNIKNTWRSLSAFELSNIIVQNTTGKLLSPVRGNSETAVPRPIFLSRNCNSGKLFLHIDSEHTRAGQKQALFFALQLLSGESNEFLNTRLFRIDPKSHDISSDVSPMPIEELDNNNVTTICACRLLDLLEMN